MPVFPHQKFFSISSNQQQRIVCASTKNQHGQNPGNRTISRHVKERSDVSTNLASHPIGRSHHRERNDPERRTSIGDQQQNHNDDDRGEKQREVGSLKDPREVCLKTFRPRHIRNHARRQPIPSNLPQFRDPLALQCDLVKLIHGHRDDGRRVVFRDSGWRDKGVVHRHKIRVVEELLVRSPGQHLNHRIKFTEQPGSLLFAKFP